jgi:hypothetical protein
MKPFDEHFPGLLELELEPDTYDKRSLFCSSVSKEEYYKTYPLTFQRAKTLLELLAFDNKIVDETQLIPPHFTSSGEWKNIYFFG